MSLLRNIASEMRGEPEAPKPVAKAFAPLPPRRAGAGKLAVPLRPEAPPPAPAPVSAEPRARQRHAATPAPVPFGPGYLSAMLKRHDTVAETSRTGTQNVHISSLSDFCARSYVLADEEAKVLDPRPTGGHRVMWALGRAAEKHVREGLIAQCHRKGILGKWRCPCRKTEVEGLWPEDVTCDRCELPLTDYREMTLIDDRNGIAGNPDLPLYIEDRLLVVEIKSINAKAWGELTGPLADHIFQGNGYHRLFRTLGYTMMPVVAYVYVTKDFKWGEPYKEYHLEPTGFTERVQDIAWSEARGLKVARKAGILPRREKCRAMTDPRAKKCPVATSCFLRSTT